MLWRLIHGDAKILVVDATGSMSIIQRVNSRALAFHDYLQRKMAELWRHIDALVAIKENALPFARGHEASDKPSDNGLRLRPT